MAARGAKHIAVLDGWRGLSILMVLAAHLLPLGPKAWQLNATAGPLGMALFFTLSGFLITHFLLKQANLADFLARRFFRIVPLAWAYLGVVMWLGHSTPESALAHFLFYANWPPIQVGGLTGHMWSLCVEVQFYLGVALLVALGGRRALLLLPLLALVVTANRIAHGVHLSIEPPLRLDEILAGATLALVHAGRLGDRPRGWLGGANQILLLVLLVLSCHPDSGALNYARPYLAALLVGATLLNPDSRMASGLNHRALLYLAAVSYALYVIHPLLAETWLGSGEGWEKYLKRPLLLAVLFMLAHASTHYYEARWIALGRWVSGRLGGASNMLRVR